VDSERHAGAWPADGAGLARAGEQLGLQVAHGVESHGQKAISRKRDPSPRPPAPTAKRVVRAVAIAHRPGMLGQVVSAIGRAGGFIGAVDFVEVSEGKLLRDATVDAAGPRPVGGDHRRPRRHQRRARRRHHRPHIPAARRGQD